ncbi:MAG: hypothetical protein ACFB21_15225 [Opitutales bacterium]
MSKNTDKNSYAKVRKEIIVFLVFLGVLIGAAGYFAFTGLRDNPHQLWGLDRHIAIGVPTLIIAVLHIGFGVCLGITSKKIFAILGALAGTILALFYFVFMISATGKPPINLVSAVVVAIPLVLWSRVSTFLKAQSSEQDVDLNT